MYIIPFGINNKKKTCPRCLSIFSLLTRSAVRYDQRVDDPEATQPGTQGCGSIGSPGGNTCPHSRNATLPKGGRGTRRRKRLVPRPWRGSVGLSRAEGIELRRSCLDVEAAEPESSECAPRRLRPRARLPIRNYESGSNVPSNRACTARQTPPGDHRYTSLPGKAHSSRLSRSPSRMDNTWVTSREK